jgi:hypothetical protein
MANLPTDGASEGTWGATLNTYLQVGHGADGTHSEAGLPRQVVNTQTGAVATGNTQMPLDDTIPQKTEGDEYMTLAITPKSATNKLRIDIVFVGGSSVAFNITVALFQDTTANALAATTQLVALTNRTVTIPLTHYMTSGTTSETTFKVRCGLSGAGTITFNGSSAGRKLGGVMASSITITEIAV